jgi:hypothetical protein
VIVHRTAHKPSVITAINQVKRTSIYFFAFSNDQFSLGHVSRDCTEPRANNYNSGGSGGGGGGGYRGGRGTFLLCKNRLIYFFF